MYIMESKFIHEEIKKQQRGVHIAQNMRLNRNKNKISAKKVVGGIYNIQKMCLINK